MEGKMSHRSVQAIQFESAVTSLIEKNTSLRRDRAFLFIMLGGLAASNVLALLAAFNIL